LRLWRLVSLPKAAGLADSATGIDDGSKVFASPASPRASWARKKASSSLNSGSDFQVASERSSISAAEYV
jgi:hypothetical protein